MTDVTAALMVAAIFPLTALVWWALCKLGDVE